MEELWPHELHWLAPHLQDGLCGTVVADCRSVGGAPAVGSRLACVGVVPCCLLVQCFRYAAVVQLYLHHLSDSGLKLPSYSIDCLELSMPLTAAVYQATRYLESICYPHDYEYSSARGSALVHACAACVTNRHHAMVSDRVK